MTSSDDINLELLNPTKNWTIGVYENLDFSINNLKNIHTVDQTISNNLVISFGRILGPSNLIIDPKPHNQDISGTVTIYGNLNVKGATTTVNSSTVDISDSILTLNKGDQNSFSQESGIEIYLGRSSKPQLLWNNDDGPLSLSKRWELKYENAINDNSFNDLKIKDLYSKNIINSEELKVSGHSTLQDLSAGATDISNGLVVTGNSIFRNDLYVNGNFFIDNIELSTYLLESSSNKVEFKNIFDLSNIYISSSNEFVDCSNSFSHTIKPTNDNKKILVNFNFNYFCSDAYNEQMNIQICRKEITGTNNNEVIILDNKNLGTKNGCGYYGNYSCSYLDEPLTLKTIKYYVKFKLNSYSLYTNLAQGIVNINTNDEKGSSSISLIEF